MYERQRLGPYCRTMQESSDRAQRSAATLEQTVDNTVSTLVYGSSQETADETWA